MRSPAIAAVEYTVYVGATTMRGKPASTVPPPLQPPVVHLYRCSGRHICGRHRGWDIHAHGADRFHAQHQS